MSRLQKTHQHIEDFLFEHPRLKIVLEYLLTFLAATLAAFLFAYSFRALITSSDPDAQHLITGGVSGFSQIVTLLFHILRLFPQVPGKTFQAIFYFLFNVPLLILAYKGIGKRFALFSAINVVITSIFIEILPVSWIHLIELDKAMMFERALFAGLLTGLGTSICYFFEISGGGLDVITYYIANYKSTSVGKYQIGFNAAILIVYTILKVVDQGTETGAINAFLFTLVYLFTNGRITDTFNMRNKKAEIQIVTVRDDMAKIILANFPHSCTVINGTGGYSGEPRFVIYMVVSSYEVKKMVRLARMLDAKVFINVSYGHQVYGRFFIKPIK